MYVNLGQFGLFLARSVIEVLIEDREGTPGA
jgi:hypothetical protein